MRAPSLFCVSLCLLTTGCIHKNRPSLAASADHHADQSFYDVRPGDRLRIVVPLTRSGSASPRYGNDKIEGATITLSANDLIGFETIHYLAAGNRHGKVKLKFERAEETREGQTTAQTNAPALSFPLPKQRSFLRLVYFIRASSADHNMAILAAKNIAALEQFTESVKQNAVVCDARGEVFCTWVPQGVAVRPES